MDLQNLISVLNKQETNLKKLLKIVNEKKEALVNNKLEKLNEIISLEENVLLAIQLVEEERLSEMENLFLENNIDNKRYKLEILVTSLTGKIDPGILNRITDFEKKIKTIVEEITKINHLNMVLIQQSRTIINDTIKAVINTSKRTILDRKV